MRANPSVNQHLNLVLKTALVAINQYFLHARMLGSWGLEGLELQEYQAAIRAMKHADKVMSRILSLNGDPAGLSLRDLGKLLVGENVSDLLGNDLKMESVYRDSLALAISHCNSQNDRVSRQNLEALHAESEHRIEWLRGQLGLIDKIGTQGYLDSSTTTVSSTLMPPTVKLENPGRAGGAARPKQTPKQTPEQAPEQASKQAPKQAQKQTSKQTSQQTPEQTSKQARKQTTKRTTKRTSKQTSKSGHGRRSVRGEKDGSVRRDPTPKPPGVETPRRRAAISGRTPDKAGHAEPVTPSFAALAARRSAARAKRVDEDSSSFLLASYFVGQRDPS